MGNVQHQATVVDDPPHVDCILRDTPLARTAIVPIKTNRGNRRICTMIDTVKVTEPGIISLQQDSEKVYMCHMTVIQEQDEMACNLQTQTLPQNAPDLALGGFAISSLMSAGLGELGKDMMPLHTISACVPSACSTPRRDRWQCRRVTGAGRT